MTTVNSVGGVHVLLFTKSVFRTDGGTLMKGTTYTIEGSGTFSLAYSPGSETITLVTGGTS